MFSYAPDRPPGGAAPRQAPGRTVGGRPAASGFGSTEKVQERLGSSELVERMRKERARATEASRARATAAVAAAASSSGGSGNGGGGQYHGTRQQDNTGYRASEPYGTAYKARGLEHADVGDGVRGGRDVGQQHRPSPPAQQRDGFAAVGGRGGGGRGGGGSGGRGGRFGAAERYQGGRSGHPPGSKKYRPANAGAGEDVHRMYEERLAKLERRLAGAGKESHRQQKQQKDSSRPRPPSGGVEEWGAENNPFGYRKLSAGEDDGLCGPFPPGSSGGRGLSRRGSEASGGEDVEGLSTIYMGPIAHKMAELRAGNG